MPSLNEILTISRPGVAVLYLLVMALLVVLVLSAAWEIKQSQDKVFAAYEECANPIKLNARIAAQLAEQRVAVENREIVFEVLKWKVNNSTPMMCPCAMCVSSNASLSKIRT